MKNESIIIGHAELIGEILKQFSFMKAMARPDDINFKFITDLNLNEVFDLADDHFIHHTIDDVIAMPKETFTNILIDFLKNYRSIVDVSAIRINILNDCKEYIQ